MFAKDEKDIFIKYSMENEEQLRLSINISNSFLDLRKEIIRKFIGELEEKIKNEFPEDEWEKTNTMKNEFGLYSGFYLSKKTWNQKNKIAFELQSRYISNPVIGIIGKNKVDIDGLYKTMNEKYKKGKQSSWIWYAGIDGYQNWVDEDVLIKMYNGKAAEDFFNIIVKIHKIATNLIDNHVNQNKELYQ